MAELQMLRSSERGQFKKCPQSWWWGYVEGLRLAGSESIPLWFGTGLHLVWAEYYIPGSKRGRNPHETWDEYCGEDNFDVVKIITDTEDGHEVFTDAKELGHIMIDEYLAEYKGDPNWYVVAPEQRIRAILPHPKDLTRPYVDLRGTIDLVVRDEAKNGQLDLVDHKHMAKLSIAHLPMDEQLGGYTTVAEHALRSAGLISKTDTIDTIIYNVLVKAKPDTRPRDPQGRYRNQPIKKDYLEALVAELEYDEDELKALHKMTLPKLQAEAQTNGVKVFGEISKRQGTRHFHREEVSLTKKRKRRQIQRIGEDMFAMNAVRNGKLPIMKSPGEHCSWCQFRELCELDESGGDTDEFKKMVFNREDPYADHREGAENSKTTVLLKRKTGVS
ncbi:Cas4 family exonuclease [Gordonia phage GretelLyn]|uniref:Cas4 family exonuclease n=2 Tax=Lambovirus sadboi TaxID=2844674 RepID=A0A5J6TB72_9CAUD|nr:exonuclease [Gordonia phage Sadboi]QFG08203.1 Cas4 family exonuclease [Gordonia phage GretelLyn]QFG14715.1 Cas4 family exonuclease [Gordonia phage Sadboi]